MLGMAGKWILATLHMLYMSYIQSNDIHHFVDNDKPTDFLCINAIQYDFIHIAFYVCVYSKSKIPLALRTNNV